MKISLLTSVVIFLIGAYLITPKIADTAAAINPDTTQNQSLTHLQLASRVANQVFSVANSDSEYEPPDYGGPDSRHGSGTR